MKVGDLVAHPLSGDIGIITDHQRDAHASLYYTVAFFNGGEFLIPQEHLELL